MKILLKKAWYLGLTWLKLVFIYDPVQNWLDESHTELKKLYEEYYTEKIRDLEAQIELLRLDIREKNSDYSLLQQEFINYLKAQNIPPVPETATTYTATLSRPSSFQYRKQKLEEKAAAKRNQEIHERIAQAEAEVGIDEQVQLVPSSESHGI